MKKSEEQILHDLIQTEKKGTFTRWIYESLEFIKNKWYWFVISICFCMGIGTLYILLKEPTYNRGMTVLIKYSERDPATVNKDYTDLNLTGESKVYNLENEMQLFHSNILIQDVIDSLKLNVIYSQKDFLRNKELYNTSPVILNIHSLKQGIQYPIDLIVKDINSKECIVSYKDKEYNLTLNQLYRFPFGTLEFQYDNNVIIPDKKEIYISILDKDVLATSLLKNIQTELISLRSSILKVNFSSNSSQKSDDILRALFASYKEYAQQDKRKLIESTDKLLDDRISKVGEELWIEDKKIENYKKTNQLSNIDLESNYNLMNAGVVEGALSSVYIQQNMVSNMVDILQNPATREELLPLSGDLANQGLIAQIESYNTDLTRYKRLIASSNTENPVVDELSKQLKSSRNVILHGLKNLQKSLDIETNSLKNRNNKISGRLNATSSQTMTLQSIQREQKIKEDLYLYLLNKKEENQITKNMLDSHARLIDTQLGSLFPVEPQKSIILFISFLAGLILPLLYFFVRNSFRFNINNKEDLQDLINIPILGEIPSDLQLKNKKTEEKIAIQDGKYSLISDALRIVGSNLIYIAQKKGYKVLAITSSQSGDGKTYITMNLAMTLALTGKKIGMIDLDLRRGQLSSYFGVEKSKGISEYLKHEVNNIGDIIQPTSLHENIKLISTGELPKNPVEILMDERYDEMINLLKDEFDFLIIDNPPTSFMADAFVANRIVDMSIFVIRSGKHFKGEAISIEKDIEENKLKNPFIIITDVNYSYMNHDWNYNHYQSYNYRPKEVN